jgi:hypothetical protein
VSSVGSVSVSLARRVVVILPFVLSEWLTLMYVVVAGGVVSGRHAGDSNDDWTALYYRTIPH